MNTNIPQVILERSKQIQMPNPNRQKTLEQLTSEFRAIQARVAEYANK